MTRLVKEGGIVAPTGKAGGMLMFHGNLVHGSTGNITPYPRKIVYLTLNAVSNYIRTPTRPEYIAHRDFTPIETVRRRRAGAAGASAAPGGGVTYLLVIPGPRSAKLMRTAHLGPILTIVIMDSGLDSFARSPRNDDQLIGFSQ